MSTAAASARLQIDTSDAARWRAAGRVSFGDAGDVLAALPVATAPVDVDLAGLTDADSATLAVLIAWAARAHRRGGQLRYRNAPRALHNLAHLSDLDAVLFGATAA